MASLSAGHIMLTPTQVTGGIESMTSEQESRDLPIELHSMRRKHEDSIQETVI